METEVGEEQVKQDIARNVLGAFGLRPFHVFDGERHHVCFAVATQLVGELNFDKQLLDDFFSKCSRSPRSSGAHKESSGVKEGPSLWVTTPRKATEENKRITPVRQDDCLSPIGGSPKEVYYIMEEHYLSASPKGREYECSNESFRAEERPLVEATSHVSREHPIGEKLQDEENHILHIGHTRKRIHFVMDNNYLSPEELRLSVCFPLLLSPPSPSKGRTVYSCSLPEPASPLRNLESTRSNAGKVKEAKVLKSNKRNASPVDESDTSQSVWLLKSSAKNSRRKGRGSQRSVPEKEPPWNGLDVGDLVEQVGDSWVEDAKVRGLSEENPSDVLNPSQAKKSFWPSPLYGSQRCQAKAPAAVPKTSNQSPKVDTSEVESSDVEDFEEFLKHSKKREEVALLKYALLFKDDQSWRKKFLDGLNLTCDICFSKRKIKKFSSVMALLAHAGTITHLRRPEHRGYAEAIRNLLRLDEPGSIPACNSTVGVQSSGSEVVWPPVVVLENTITAIDHDGCFVGLSVDCLTRMLKALGDQGKRKLHCVFGESGVTGQVLVEFPATHRGWIDARRVHHQFELRSRSYEDWLKLKPKYKALLDDTIEVQECNGLVNVLEDSESVKRILYGYLATPQVMKHVDSSKQYVDWKVQNLRKFFDVSDSCQE